MGSFTDIVLQYVCPTLGSVMASVMFAGKKKSVTSGGIEKTLIVTSHPLCDFAASNSQPQFEIYAKPLLKALWVL